MKRFIVSFILLAYAAISHADNGFSYQSQPIHPGCLAKFVSLDSDSAQKSISLASCTKTSKAPMLVDDFYQTNVKENNTIAYRVINHKKNHYLLITRLSTNGSGIFTSALWIEKTGDQLHLLNILAAGDRCNGGVSEAKAWEYAVNLTPVDIVSLGEGPTVRLDAYRDLDASAVSCIAKAVYQVNPDTGKALFSRVKLNKTPLDIEPWVMQLNFQYCFNRLYNSYIDRGQIILTQTDLNRFKNQFEGICMASGR